MSPGHVGPRQGERNDGAAMQDVERKSLVGSRQTEPVKVMRNVRSGRRKNGSITKPRGT